MIRPYCWRDLASRAEARRTGPGILAAVNNSPGPSRIAPYGRYATRFQVLRVAALRGERERERAAPECIAYSTGAAYRYAR
jgi:hypothetical protein